MPDVFSLGDFRPRRNLAVFDYDWTLVKPRSKGARPRGEKDVQWYNALVVPTLRELYQRRYAIVVLTNQRQRWARSQIQTWLAKLKVPLLVGVAYAGAEKKPSRTLFDATVTWPWSKQASFYAGDALGRPGDWAATDKEFAHNVGLVVHSPEDLFQNHYPLLAVQPRLHRQEIVVLVGYPGSGKSTLARNLFAPNDYACVAGANPQKKAHDALQAGAAVVVDATNPAAHQRARYTRLAKKFKVPARCVYFAVKRPAAFARNQQRPEPVPVVVYDVYDHNFEMPSRKEGFAAVIVLS